jgi:hypothetical protein
MGKEVTGCKLQVTGSRLQAKGCRLQGSGCKGRDGRWKMEAKKAQGAKYKSQVAGLRLQGT